MKLAQNPKSLVLKNIFLFTGLVFAAFFIINNSPATQDSTMQKMMMQPDTRISLNMMPMQKRHQLRNMRSHVEAVQAILLAISQEKFEDASKIAHEKLGMTTEMKMMCSAFGNKQFEELGFAFHNSADKLGDVLLTRNTKKAMAALANTMSYCVRCHATFKQ